MFESLTPIHTISFFVSLWAVLILAALWRLLSAKRTFVLERLDAMASGKPQDEEDILAKPLLERTLGPLARQLGSAMGQITPGKMLAETEARLVRAGNPKNTRPGDVLAAQGILGLAFFSGSPVILRFLGYSGLRLVFLSLALGVLAAYMPWFWLTRTATRRQEEIRRNLPDVMDFLVVCLEAGLSFDMGLLRVSEKFRGAAGEEFQRTLREIQLGKPRRDALRDMADRVDLEELTFLVNAVVQAEQLGVGLTGVFRLQSDLIRDRRQQQIEESAMKAPVKMLFPLILFIFPSILVVILGPAILNIMATLAGR